MAPIFPPGLDWCIAGLLAAAVALLGALLQTAVLVTRAPVGRRGVHLRAALSGPLAAVLIGTAGGLGVDLFDVETKTQLDHAWFVLPLLALAAWFSLNRWLIRGLSKASPPERESP